MDKAGRQVFAKYKRYIRQNYHLDNATLDNLEENGTMTGENIEEIQAKTTNADKISTLLLILQRKGPLAFDRFLDALTISDNGHLATFLREKYEREKEIQRENNDINQSQMNERGAYRIDLCTDTTQTRLKEQYDKINWRLRHDTSSEGPVHIEQYFYLVDELLEAEQDIEAKNEQLQQTIDKKKKQITKQAIQIYNLQKELEDSYNTSMAKMELQMTVEDIKRERDFFEEQMKYGQSRIEDLEVCYNTCVIEKQQLEDTVKNMKEEMAKYKDTNHENGRDQQDPQSTWQDNDDGRTTATDGAMQYSRYMCEQDNARNTGHTELARRRNNHYLTHRSRGMVVHNRASRLSPGRNIPYNRHTRNQTLNYQRTRGNTRRS